MHNERCIWLINVVCLQCGKEFLVKSSKVKKGEGKYCSKACVGKSQQKQITLICEVCGKEFSVWNSKKDTRRYCSLECAFKNRPKKDRTEYKCSNCGKLFYVLSKTRTGKTTYCSKKCYTNSQAGVPSNNTGIKWDHPHPCKGKWKLAGKTCEFCGKTVTDRSWKINQTEKYNHHYCSRKCAGLAQRKTDKICPRSYGRTEYKEWKIAVLARDGGKCRLCEKDGTINRKKLQIHHIIPYSIRPDLEFNIDNGVAICKKHHDLMRNKEDEWAEQLAKLIGKPLLSTPKPNSHVLRGKQ